jgi:microcystin-dependent protein
MDSMIGEIRMMAGAGTPDGWLPCDGRAVPIATYPHLYSLFGTIYGGDGTTTFGLPDLRGRLPVCAGQGAGLSLRSLGEQFGQEQVTLTLAQIPQHRHDLNYSGGLGTSLIPGVELMHATVQQDSRAYRPKTGPNDTRQTCAPNAVTSAGGNQPHSNLMPAQTIAFIVCVQGRYPN